MKLLLTTMAVLFIANFAQANDGATPFVDVRGVYPGSSKVSSNVDVTDQGVYVSGPEMKDFFNYMPVDSVEPSQTRSVHFNSKGYVAQINCSAYADTVSGEEGHSCQFVVAKSQTYNNPKVIDDPEQEDHVGDFYYVEAEAFGKNGAPLSQNYVQVKNQGISVKAGTDTGRLFSVYGNQAGVFAKALPASEQNGSENFYGYTLYDDVYQLFISCQKDYVNPATGESKDDYRCDFHLQTDI